jgi:hypothetical protein
MDEKTVVVRNQPGTLHHKGGAKDSPIESSEIFDWRCSHLRKVIGFLAGIQEVQGRKVLLCGACGSRIMRGAAIQFVEAKAAARGK